MKILIVSQYFWPEDFRINDLALRLKDQGHLVSVLTGLPNYPSGRIYKGFGLNSCGKSNFDGINVFRVPIFARRTGKAWQLLLNYLSFAFWASLFTPFLCRDNYDVIFVFEPSPVTVGLPAILLKWLKSSPIVFWVQDLWPETLVAVGVIKSRKILKIVDHLVRFIYSKCDLILVQSRVFTAYIKNQDVPADRIRYFPNSAEAFYKPVKIFPDDPEKQLMPVGFRLVFAGNIGDAQDFETILAAAEKLKSYPDIKFVIIGDGRKFQWVKEQIVKRGLEGQVCLLGRYPAEQMPRFFSLADALLVTLKSNPVFALTIPSKIQSYLASAKPIIAALDGEGARVVNDADAGFTCPAGSSRQLADCVAAMYELSEEKRQSLGYNARKYFEENFEIGMLMDRLGGWLKELQRPAA